MFITSFITSRSGGASYLKINIKGFEFFCSERLGEPRDVPKELGWCWGLGGVGVRDTCVETGVRFGVFCTLRWHGCNKKNCQAKKRAQNHYGALIFLILNLDMNIE
jgi:hypothetical protein